MLTIEDLYHKYMDGNIEHRITNHLTESDPEFKKVLEESHNVEVQLEQMIDQKASTILSQYIYRKLILEEIKLAHAFKEGFLMATKISQEVSTNQNKIR